MRSNKYDRARDAAAQIAELLALESNDRNPEMIGELVKAHADLARVTPAELFRQLANGRGE